MLRVEIMVDTKHRVVVNHQGGTDCEVYVKGVGWVLDTETSDIEHDEAIHEACNLLAKVADSIGLAR
jgi:hypothetical protein